MTTKVPIQLVDPTGSTAGQMAVSQGPSAAPAWSNTVSNLTSNGSTSLTNTVNGGQALILTGNGATTPKKYLGVISGVFTIYNNAANAQLFAITDAGNATVTGSLTVSQTAGIVGTTTNNNAVAGAVGEYQTATTSATSLTTAVAANLASISLTAGDWDVEVTNQFVMGTSATMTSYVSSVSTTSATLGTFDTRNSVGGVSASQATFGNLILASPVVRVSIAATTTVYSVGLATFSGGTMTANGFIRARRVR